MAAEITSALIAGGGTGGHLSIAIAIGQALVEMAPEARVVLVGCQADTDGPMLRESGFPFHVVSARPWPGGVHWHRFHECAWDGATALASGLLAVGRSLLLLRRERPEVVIGTGGYGSVPAVVAAWILGVPTLVHEADSVVGMANRLLARFARSITLGYGEAAGAWCGDRATVTGNPVRRGFSVMERSEARRRLGLGPSCRLIVALGGSQGARSINHALLGAAETLLEDDATCLLQVAGRRDYEMVEQEIEKLGESQRKRHWVHPFLDEEEMATALAAADAVVTRGGASALAEVAVSGVPAVVIPYPFARQGHQASNAGLLVKRGQAVVLNDRKLNATSLLASLGEVWRLKRCGGGRLGDSSARWGCPNPASRIASLAIRLVEGGFATKAAMR